MESVSTLPVVDMEQICIRYGRLYAGLVFDVLEELGYPNQVLSHEIMPLALDMKVAGPAFTVKAATAAEKDEDIRFRRLKSLKDMTFPCVEVRDRGTPFRVALYGELTATSAKAHGAVGAIVDGGTRDSGMIIEMGFPLFARYRTPIEAYGRTMTLACQVPVILSGELTETVVVNPGDFVFGDLDGVLIIPKHLTCQVLQKCEEIAGTENLARADFQKKDDPVEVFKRYRRL